MNENVAERTLVDIDSIEFDEELGNINAVLRQRKAAFILWVREEVRASLAGTTASENVIEFSVRNNLTYQLQDFASRWVRMYGNDYRPIEVKDEKIKELEDKFAGLFDDYDPEYESINGEVQPGVSYLHQAVMDKNIEEVKNLVAKGADTNKKDGSGRTPYGRAKALGFTEIADFLEAFN